MPQTDTTTSVKTRTAVKTLVAVALTAGAIAAAAGIVSLANRPSNKPVPLLKKPALIVAHVTPPNSGTYVKGSSDVDMLGVSFSPQAALTVKSVKFDLATDDDGEFASDTANDVTAADHINSCSLFDSASGALVLGPVAPDTTGTVTFAGTVSVSGKKTFTLGCDFAGVDPQSGNDDIYAYMIASSANISAEDSTGTAIPTSKIMIGSMIKPGVNTDKLVNQTITGGGNLSFATDGSTPSSTLVLGNSTNVKAAVFNFTATGEDFTVKEITLHNCIAASDEDGDCADSGEIPGDDSALASVTLRYQNSSGMTETQTTFFSSTRARVTGLDIYVPQNETRKLEVSVDTNSVGPAGADSGSEFQVNLNGMANFEAVGMSSGMAIVTVWDDAVSNKMVLRATKPTMSLASGSPSGAGVPGLNEVLRFNVSADSHGDVELEQIIFKIISTDNSGSGWSNCGDGVNKVFGNHARWALYDTDDLSTPISDEGDWSLLTSSGAACGQLAEPVNRAVLNLGADLTTDVITVSAGSTKTFVLKVDTTGASAADDDTIRFSVANENATGTDAILWSDGYATDIDGTYVKNLPVTGGTIVY